MPFKLLLCRVKWTRCSNVYIHIGLACGPTGQNLFRLVRRHQKEKKNTNKLRSVALGLVLHSTASPTTKKLGAEYSFMLHCLPSTSLWPHPAPLASLRTRPFSITFYDSTGRKRCPPALSNPTKHRKPTECALNE